MMKFVILLFYMMTRISQIVEECVRTVKGSECIITNEWTHVVYNAITYLYFHHVVNTPDSSPCNGTKYSKNMILIFLEFSGNVDHTS